MTLPEELHKFILMLSFEYAWDIWTFVEHRAHIENWAITLNTTHPKLEPDVRYAKNRWMAILHAKQKLIEDRLNRNWTIFTEEVHTNLWNITREGIPPWITVYRKLYLKNRKWWHDDGGSKKWDARYRLEETDPDLWWFLGVGVEFLDLAAEATDAVIFPPWDRYGRRRNISRNKEDVVVPAWRGPSGIAWNRLGVGHPTLTWATLKQAADQDIAWLQRQ